MKKIFTLFTALIMVMSMSAKDIYLNPGPWDVDGAKFSVYSIKTESFSNFLSAEDSYKATVEDDTKVIFVRHDPSATTPSWDNKWNQTNDLTIPETENCYTITGWNQEDGKWSVYDPEAIPTYYITGNEALVGNDNWNASEITMVYNEETKVHTYTFTALAAGVQCKLKITDGTWGKSWGYDVLTSVPQGVKVDKDRNIVFTLAEQGNVTVSFDGKKITIEGNFYVSDIPEVIKYVLMGVAGDWENGIELTVNPDNDNEYRLLGQTITAEDAVKVVTLTDGEATSYCSKVDGYSVAHEFDDKGNIVLAPGKYDFYYKVSEDEIFIQEVTESSLEDVIVNVKATKVIRNGQIYVIRDGVMYNALGQIAE